MSMRFSNVGVTQIIKSKPSYAQHYYIQARQNPWKYVSISATAGSKPYGRARIYLAYYWHLSITGTENKSTFAYSYGKAHTYGV